MPEPRRKGISNFIDNLREVNTAGEALPQGRPEVASRAVIRFAVNSTVGRLGLVDVATAMGVDRQREDLGQTLGWWGVARRPLSRPATARPARGLWLCAGFLAMVLLSAVLEFALNCGMSMTGERVILKTRERL